MNLWFRLSKDVADFVDVIHSDGSLKPTILHIPPLTGIISIYVLSLY